MIEKIRADIPAGELALADIESFSDQPIVRGAGDTAHDAIKTMWPLKWKRREAAGKDRNPRADFEVYRRNTDATAGNSRNVPPTAVSRR